MNGEIKIYKYPLLVTDEQIIEMPKGAAILCVQTQGVIPSLWAIVDTANVDKIEKRIIATRGTGHTIDFAPNNAIYLDTYQLGGGSFVGHVFEIIR